MNCTSNYIKFDMKIFCEQGYLNSLLMIDLYGGSL